MSSLQTAEYAPTETWTPPPPIEWPPPPTPTSTPSARRRLFLAAVVGLAVGALVVGGVWFGTSLIRPPDTEATRACTLLESLPAFTTESLTQSNGAELRTASELSATAARNDQQYSRLADATRQAYLASTELDVAAVDQQVRTALSECRR